MSPRAWRIALFVLMAATMAFAVRPLMPPDGPENWFPEADKVLHLWLFALLWWIGLRAGFRAGWLLALGLVAYGVSIELAQALTPTRAASGLDLLADCTGIAVGWFLTRLRLSRQPQENRG